MRKPVVVNVLWSLFGTGLPLSAGILAIPPLIEALGTARFGILSLAWVVVGYFGFFDLGLGRAMTQLIARKIGSGNEEDIPFVAHNGMALMTILGILGGLLVMAMSPWLVGSKLAIPDELRSETLNAFYLLAASIPVVILTTGLRGILEARQRFDVVNLVRAPLGALTYLGPLLVLPYSTALPAVVLTLVAGRLMFFVVYLVVCIRMYPELVSRPCLRKRLLRQMVSFGGWMTVSNIAGPLLLYLGRVVLAVMVSAEAVAYFSTPYDMVTHLLLIPGIFASVLFPMFTQKFQSDRECVRPLYYQSLRYTFLVMFPISVLAFMLAEPVLTWWISESFSEKSYYVAQLLAIGIFINSFGHLSQAVVQAYGRPDLTAKLHVVELAAYVPYLMWLIERYGMEGAAFAWILRVGISTAALAVIANGCVTGTTRKPNS